MAIKHAKIVIPAEAGISSLPGQGLQEDPGFRRDDDIVGLFGCRSNNQTLVFGCPCPARPPPRER